MCRYRRVPIAMVLSLFVRPSIHAHEPILCLVHGQFAVLGGSCGEGEGSDLVRRRCRFERVYVVVIVVLWRGREAVGGQRGPERVEAVSRYSALCWPALNL